jgi:hypothetical protein
VNTINYAEIVLLMGSIRALRFRAHLEVWISYAVWLNSAKGERLNRLWQRIEWPELAKIHSRSLSHPLSRMEESGIFVLE